MGSGEENAELVRVHGRRFIETGEVPEEVLHPEIEWGTLVETYRGVEGVREWQRQLATGLGEVDIELASVEAVGDRVVAETVIRGIAQITGIEGEVRSWTVWTLRDGLVVRVESFVSRDAALAAARDPG